MRLVIDGWLLAQHGHGTASFARTLVDSVLRSPWGSRVRVAVPSGTSAGDADAGHRLELRRGSIPSGPLAEVLWQRRLARRLAREGAALLAPAPFLRASRARRSVVVCHDLIPLDFPRYLGRFLYRGWIFRAQLRSLRAASRVIADSNHTRDQLRAYFGASAPPITTIPLWTSMADGPVPSREARLKARTRYRLPEQYWLYVGGYDYRKNVECLIGAYAIACRARACPPLVLAGRIPTDLRAPICDVAGAIRRAGLPDDAIQRPGFIDPSDLAAVYAGAELFIYPSLAEGFGLPPVEAMACGCPALVADATSLPEVVVDSGYRFDPRNVTGLARQLEDAARTPLALNPGFDRGFFGTARGTHAYVAVIDAEMAGA